MTREDKVNQIFKELKREASLSPVSESAVVSAGNFLKPLRVRSFVSNTFERSSCENGLLSNISG